MWHPNRPVYPLSSSPFIFCHRFNVVPPPTCRPLLPSSFHAFYSKFGTSLSFSMCASLSVCAGCATGLVSLASNCCWLSYFTRSEVCAVICSCIQFKWSLLLFAVCVLTAVWGVILHFKVEKYVCGISSIVSSDSSTLAIGEWVTIKNYVCSGSCHLFFEKCTIFISVISRQYFFFWCKPAV